MSINISIREFYKKAHLLTFATFLAFFLPNSTVFAASDAHQQEEFNPGETIIEHIVDAYQWHIATYKDKHITIYLPVILIDHDGLHVFSSSHLYHGEGAYLGYTIWKEKDAKEGKIVKLNEEGVIDTDFFYLDLSITKNVLSLLISIAFILIVFLTSAKGYKKRGEGAPKGIARVLEPLVLFVRDDVARPAIGHKYEKYLPFLLTTFFFIFINNLIGLIPIFPGGANLTGNIAVTLVLALFTFVITNVSGNRTYWLDIVNTPGVPWWLKIPLPLMPVVEIIGVLTKPIVLTIRLFANITAGHIIALGFVSLIFIFGQMSPIAGYGVSVVSVFFYIFMALLELLVAFIQAFVFTLLSAIYIGMAIEEHHHEEAPSHSEIK